MNQRKEYKFGDIHGSQVAIGDNSKTSQYMETNTSEKRQPPAEAESQSLLKRWKRKLDYLQQQEAIAADSSIKFQLQEQIKECQQRVKELGG